MGERHFLFTPGDTLFLRDGRPFFQEDAGLAEARSLFPPHGATLIGALRLAAARGQGWTPSAGRWRRGDRLGQVLGDGPDDLGALSFGAVTLVRAAGGGLARLFAAPLALLGREAAAGQALAVLRPGPALRCDLGPAVCLPQVEGGGEGWKTLADHWLTASGMAAFLAGAMPARAELVAESALWRVETRIGLARHYASRAAVTGQLYAAGHIRPAAAIGLLVSVSGLPAEWPVAGSVPLGGEGRFAWVEELAAGACPPPPAGPAGFSADADGSVRYAATLLAPADLPADGWPRPGGALGGLPGTLIAACAGRAVAIGGWQGGAGPRPLRPHLPAGSVFFLRAPAEQAAAIAAHHLGAIGAGTGHGLGRIAIGHWPGAHTERIIG